MRSRNIILLVNQRLTREARRKKSVYSQFQRAGMGLGAFLSLVLAAGVALAGFFYADLTSELPSLETLPVLLNAQNGLLLQPTTLYDRTDQHVIFTLDNPGVTRRYLSIDPNLPDHLSPVLVQSVVTILDPSFWQNPGFSWQHLGDTRPVTLGERLVDELLLGTEPPGLRRALRMRLLAAQLSAHYGRSLVLEWFLNSAYFGHLAYGADSAAQLYLGKSASQIDLAESALLLAAYQSPALNPIDTAVAARERQVEILGEMQAAGLLNGSQYQNIINLKPAARPVPAQSIQPALAFSNQVIDQLSEKFGRSRLEQGGLHIVTTLDYDLQVQTACALQNQLARLEGVSKTIDSIHGSPCESSRLLPTLPPVDPPLPAGLMGSAILLDPQTGEILAFLGDSTLKNENPTVTSHAPGSLLTPFIAVASFARGTSPASLLWDLPASLPDELSGRQNPDGKYHGPVRLRIALANDYLVPLAHVLYQIGPGNVWRFNAPLGLTRLADSPNPADLLFAGGEITLPEIAEAYSAFASLGKQAGQRSSSSSSYQPKSVLTVQDLTGRMILDDRISQSQAVLSPQLAYLVHNILADETARWPSQGYPNALEIGRPVGGKMGQVAGNQQVWTVGYTGARLAVTWLGLPPGTPANIELNPKMSAGIWHAVIQYASRDQPAQNWELPPGITTLFVCDPSGLLATRDCPTQVNELFISGSEPTSPDSLFQVFQVNRETGLLATAFTPLEMIDERTYLVFPAEYQQYAEAMGIAQPPRNYDSILPPPPIPGAQITNPKMFAYLSSVVKLIGDAAGDNFYSYHIQFGQGLNPRSWSQIAPETTQPVQNGILASWDTRMLEDGLYAVRLVVVRNDQLIDTATLQVTVDNTPPLVSVTYPVPGQTFDQQSQRQITLQAEIQETVGLQKVAWYIDGGLVGQSFQPPFSLPWTAAAGEHSLIVKAVDLAGNPGESSPLRFTVK